MKRFNLLEWFRQLRMFVIADPRDNSITFSKALYKKLRLLDYEKDPKAYVFYLPSEDKYAFCINPELGRDDAPLAEIQYNTKYSTIGFECLVPTVQKIFYDYGLLHDRPCKLTVTEHVIEKEDCNLNYYVIEWPYV